MGKYINENFSALFNNYKANARKELRDRATSRMKDMGVVPSSYGITKEPILDSVTDETERLLEQQKVVQGGTALDIRGAPPGNSYGQRRYEFLKTEEGVRKTAYDDKTGRTVADLSAVEGNPTIGIGFNLNRPDAGDVLVGVLGVDKKDVEALKTGKKSLDEGQVRTLFDYTIQEAESIVSNKFKDVPLKEHQRLALVSLAFNNPSLIGPNLTKYVQAGDWKAAKEEIKFRSNASNHKGLQARRDREADLFYGIA